MIETLFGALIGVLLTVGSGSDMNTDPASMIYKGITTGNKIIQKEKDKKEADNKEKSK